MADLTVPTSSCCAAEEQATCCEPSEKSACCSVGAAAALADAGLVDVEVRLTHQVHEHASSAIVRARKPKS